MLVALVAVQRLAELQLSRRHSDRARARGGVEYGRGHYPAMVLLHTAFLVGCVLEVALLDRPFRPALAAAMAVLFAAATALRLWCITSLGPFWTTRVWVVPGASLVERGPYAFLRHPNYLAVAVEGVALPLLHGAWITATAFTLANAALMSVRIPCEDRALAGARAAPQRESRARRIGETAEDDLA
jgi:methyltransferase